ncbi:hypothetical protein FRC07_002341 [Ceratobasidium sp. 392]|nr:hypothetical protein FRC07_002341 [Ceratobasidium sp. 392]
MSSPPDVATLLDGPLFTQCNHSPVPLVTQELFPLQLCDKLEGNKFKQAPAPNPAPNPVPLPTPLPAPVPALTLAPVPAPALALAPMPAPAPAPAPRYPWSLYPGGHDKVIPLAQFEKLFSCPGDCLHNHWLACEDSAIIQAVFKHPYSLQNKKILQAALTAPKATGYHKVLVDNKFKGKRKVKTIHSRLCLICRTWTATVTLQDLITNAVITFSCPEAEVLDTINGGGPVYLPLMTPYLDGHPTYSPPNYQSGHVFPFGLDASSFWTNNSNLNNYDYDYDNGVAGPSTFQTSSVAQSLSDKGKGKAQEVEPSDNLAVKGSVSSLPSAPSTISEPNSSASAAAHGTRKQLNSGGYVVPRRPKEQEILAATKERQHKLNHERDKFEKTQMEADVSLKERK